MTLEIEIKPIFGVILTVNPYKACIYGLCRDFLDGVGYDLGTKLTGVHDKVLHCNIKLFNLVVQIKQFEHSWYP